MQIQSILNAIVAHCFKTLEICSKIVFEIGKERKKGIIQEEKLDGKPAKDSAEKSSIISTVLIGFLC